MDEVVVCFIHFVIAKNNIIILSLVRLFAKKLFGKRFMLN